MKNAIRSVQDSACEAVEVYNETGSDDYQAGGRNRNWLTPQGDSTDGLEGSGEWKLASRRDIPQTRSNKASAKSWSHE